MVPLVQKKYNVKGLYSSIPQWPVRVPPVAFLAAFIVLAAAVVGQFLLNDFEGVEIFLPGIVVGLFVLSSLKIAKQWERAVVLRLGKFSALKGPGLFFIIPVIDQVSAYVDQRIRATDFAAETCLTRDTVPVNVDAIAFWIVWDAEKAILEVEHYFTAIVLSAQTGLRDMIGKHELSELIKGREELGKVLRDALDEKTNPWGITVQSVEIRDVVIPKDLEDAMSRQAQAERERQARIILGTAETEISEKFAEASQKYLDNPVALNLRAMNILYEGIKEKASLLVVPSGLAESLNTGAYAGLAALSREMTRAEKEKGKA
jgi:regulator of protease activity HflC (stomatin/prohibitin superfamily)